MNLGRFQPNHGGRRLLVWVSVVVNVLLFTVFSILIATLTALIRQRYLSGPEGMPPPGMPPPPGAPFFPGMPPPPPPPGGSDLGLLITINAGAALAAILVAPYLLQTFERMQQRMTRQGNELRSLHAVDNAIARELRLDVILEVAVKQATIAVDGEMGALWLFDESDRLTPTAQAFYNIAPASQGYAREVMLAQRSVHERASEVPQRIRDLDLTWRSDPAAAALGLRNAVTIPIKTGENVLGVLMIGNRSDPRSPLQGFTEEDTDLLRDVTTTVSVAVQNARLFAEMRHRGDMLRSLIARTGEAIAASSDAPRLMELLAYEAANILGADRIAVYALDGALSMFMPMAAYDASTSQTMPALARAGSVDSFHKQPLPMDMLLPPTVTAEEPTDRYVLDVRAALGLPRTWAEFLAGPGFLFVLRSRENQCIGLICMLDAAPRPADGEIAAMAEALASQAAVALENAQLAEKTKELLERSQALQDATYRIAAELDPERVVQGIIDSAWRVLGADGYTLWDYDQAADDWTKRASDGLQPDLVTDDGGPVERPLLDRVRDERAPRIIPNTAHMPSPVPLFVESEPGRGMLALPLLYAGQFTGVLALYYETPRAFVEEEVELAQSFANQAGNALENARLYMREKRIAEKLQESLLPAIPNREGPFELAHKYRAGLGEAEIGGDFYDIFPLGGDRVGMVMADVSGKGLKAAVQTAMIKYTLRGFAIENPDSPVEVLTRLNKVLCADASGLSGFVTLFYGILDKRTGEISYANAGHEPPLLRGATDGSVVALEMCDGMALGCFPFITYSGAVARLNPGDVLFLFTDGLTEARGPGAGMLGAEGLTQILATSGRSAPEIVENVYRRVNSYAENNLRDDVAMLVVRNDPEE